MYYNQSTTGTTDGRQYKYTEEEVADIRIETYFAVKKMMEEKYRKKLQKILREREVVANDEGMSERSPEDIEELRKGSMGVWVHLPSSYALRPGHVAAMVAMFEHLNAQSRGEPVTVDETSYPTVEESIEKIESVLSMNE